MKSADHPKLRHTLALALSAWATAGGAAPADVQTVVVTASRYALAPADAPASISVVTRRDIEARGADNALDAVRSEPGLSLQGRAVGGRKVISLRGLDSRHTLFLVNGQRVGASDGVIGASDFEYDWVAAEDIERIEVVRGPLSVLYGSEALGGVVNIITREPGNDWRGGVALQGMQADGGRGGSGSRLAVRADGPLGDARDGGTYLRLGAAQAHDAAVASPVDPRLSELEGRDKQDAWAGMAWRGAGQQLDFDLRLGHEVRVADARERGGAKRYNQSVNDIQRSMAALGWRAEWPTARLGQPVETQLRAYNSTIAVVNTRTAGVTVNAPQTLQENVVEGQARAPLGLQPQALRQALTGGFELRNETLADPGLPGGQSTAQHRAVYVQNEVAIAQAVRLTAGLRYDHHGFYGGEWSPRLYAVWRASPQWTVKGGYSHGFRAPNLKQIVPGSRAEGPDTFIGNPDLGPETSDGVELTAAWASGKRQLQATVFDQTVHQLIDVQLLAVGSVPGTGTYTYVSVAQARMTGFEGGWAQPLGAGFSTQISYTYLDARNGDQQRLDRRPRHVLAARLDQQTGPWRGGLNVEFNGSQTLPTTTAVGAPSQAVPDTTLLGAHLVRALPAGLELTLAVQNLGNLRLADRSTLYTQVERPRTWRLALRGRW